MAIGPELARFNPSSLVSIHSAEIHRDHFVATDTVTVEHCSSDFRSAGESPDGWRKPQCFVEKWTANGQVVFFGGGQVTMCC